MSWYKPIPLSSKRSSRSNSKSKTNQEPDCNEEAEDKYLDELSYFLGNESKERVEQVLKSIKEVKQNMPKSQNRFLLKIYVFLE